MTPRLTTRYLKQTQFISSAIHWWDCIVVYRQPPDEPEWFNSQEWMTEFFFDWMSCQDYESIDQEQERLRKESIVNSEIAAVCRSATQEISMDHRDFGPTLMKKLQEAGYSIVKNPDGRP